MTPSTANVHGGWSGSESRRWGSTQPPMQASTWQRTRLPRRCGDRLDRVDDAVGVGRRGGDDEDGAVVDGRRHRLGVGAFRHGVDVDEDGLDAEPVRGLVEGRVRRRRQDHPGCRDVGRASRAASTASRIDSVPPEVTTPANPVRRVDEPARDADEVVLHGEQRGERRRVEAVRRGERRERLTADRVGRSQTRVVDVGEGASAVGGQVAGAHGRAARTRARISSWSMVIVVPSTVVGGVVGGWIG